MSKSNSYAVRGGSWLSIQRLARCAYCHRSPPNFFDNNLGFRVLKADEEKSVLHTVRGGSWFDFQKNARYASCYWNLPDFFNLSLGFRVLREKTTYIKKEREIK